MKYTEMEVLDHHREVLSVLVGKKAPAGAQEAIEWQRHIDMCQSTIRVLEKEVAKKPIWVRRELTEDERQFGLTEAELVTQCPYCHEDCRTFPSDETAHFGDWHSPERCPNCNQKLDWNGEPLIAEEADQLSLDI